MTAALLPCVELGPEDAEATILWLHGLGADGHDFEPVVPYLGLPAEAKVRFVFPHAPKIPVTLNAGMVMPAWYDILDLDLERRHDMDGVRTSRERVLALLERERERGVPAERTILAGFSQGGAIALYTALRHEEALAGCMALSTYLVGEEDLPGALSEANRSLPLLQIHGRFDPMVPMERGEACRDRLVELGYGLEWESYPMQHEICMEELQRIGEWLRERLG